MLAIGGVPCLFAFVDGLQLRVILLSVLTTLTQIRVFFSEWLLYTNKFSYIITFNLEILELPHQNLENISSILQIRLREIKDVPPSKHVISDAAAGKSLQSCPALCDPIDGSPPGSAVPGILQARTLEWVAISFSNAWKWKVKVKSLSRARLLVTPWTAAHQAPLSMGFSRQEYWSGLPLPDETQIKT